MTSADMAKGETIPGVHVKTAVCRNCGIYGQGCTCPKDGFFSASPVHMPTEIICSTCREKYYLEVHSNATLKGLSYAYRSKAGKKLNHEEAYNFYPIATQGYGQIECGCKELRIYSLIVETGGDFEHLSGTVDEIEIFLQNRKIDADMNNIVSDIDDSDYYDHKFADGRMISVYRYTNTETIALRNAIAKEMQRKNNE